MHFLNFIYFPHVIHKGLTVRVCFADIRSIFLFEGWYVLHFDQPSISCYQLAPTLISGL
jgi:hypothetical protein